jgi:hypothetical protein
MSITLLNVVFFLFFWSLVDVFVWSLVDVIEAC